MKRAMQLTLFITIFLLIIASGCANRTQINEPAKEINPKICEESGGKWNECGSACTGTNSEICIQVCVSQCECGGIQEYTCPEGYYCKLSGKETQEIGVCTNEQN